MTETPVYLAKYSHWNVHSDAYDSSGSSPVEPSEFNEPSDWSPQALADELLKEFISNEHMRADGALLPYGPATGEYRVQLWAGDTTEGNPIATATS